MSKVVYAIQVGKLSYSDLNVLDVKIGHSKDIKRTLAGYKRSHREPEILDLWKSNEDVSIIDCERGIQDLAEKYAYDRDGEKFIFLQDSYNDFSENVSKLLKPIKYREGKREKKAEGGLKRGRRKIEEYTGKTPKSIRFRGGFFEVNTWRDVVKTVANEIYKEKEDFSKVLDIKGRTRVYFSKDEEKLVAPISIPDTPYYFEGKISANRSIRITKHLLDKFGYKKSDFEIRQLETA